MDTQTAGEALHPLFRVCVGFLVVDTVFLLLRFTAVLFLRPKKLALAWDDYLLIPAYILNVGLVSTGLVIHHHADATGFTGGQSLLSPAAIPLLKADFAISQITSQAFAFTRFSILALFLRLFERSYVRLATIFLIVFVALQTIAFDITAAVQCLPSDWYWKRAYYPPNQGPGKCVDLDKFYRAFQSPEMFVDLAIIVLPLPEVWRLRSSKNRKIGLTTLFLTGLIALLANCFRQATFVRWNFTEFTPRMTNATTLWLVAEPSVCFIAACLPAMQPLLTLFSRSTLRKRANRAVIPTLQQSGTPGTEGFQRLVDPERVLTPETKRLSKVHGTDLYEYHAKAARSTTSVEFDAAAPPSVPLQDWSQLRNGEGVLMHTEVSVTQEDRIADVLGF